MSTSMWRHSAGPNTEPAPGTTLSTPSGRPAAVASSAMRKALSDVCLAGLTTRLLPAARAGPIFQASICAGKFHGRIMPTTPMGSRTIIETMSGPLGETRSWSLSTSSACQWMQWIASGMSMVVQSKIGLPASMESSRAISIALASNSSTNLSSTALRSAALWRDQRPSANALRATATARLMSLSSQAAMVVIFLPLAGLIEA